MKERWRPVRGYTESYEVSDRGGVRSVARTIVVIDAKNKRAYDKHLKASALALTDHSAGYRTVQLWRNNVGEKVYVHALVAEAFVGKRTPGMVVNHKNMIRSDNRDSNLEWTTNSGNLQHAIANGIKVGRPTGAR